MADTKKFKFKLLTGVDPQAQYDAIVTKDELTFYLLNNGIGYLGTTPLFGGGANTTVLVNTSGTLSDLESDKLYFITTDGVKDTDDNDIAQGVYYSDGSTLTDLTDKGITKWIADNAVKDMTGDSYAGDDTTLPTTKAVIDYVSGKLNDSSILSAQFFRTVVSYTLTDEDIDGTSDIAATGRLSLPTDAKAGDIGLLFTKDDDMDDDTTDTNESYYFISLEGFIDIYEFTDSNSITVTKTDGKNEFSFDLNVNENEASIIVDANGVSLNKTDTINDGDGTDPSIPEPSEDKLVTEKALIDYINNTVLKAVSDAIEKALEDVVTYSIDD